MITSVRLVPKIRLLILPLWTSLVHLIALGELLGPSLLKGMPYCFTSPTVEKYVTWLQLPDTNATLIVSKLDKASFWAASSDFKDIFNVDHFITSLRDEVRIIKQLPPKVKRTVEQGLSYSMSPIS
ncbi:hypothetical protein CR513_15013, partial [Mucuna pruriens]